MQKKRAENEALLFFGIIYDHSPLVLQPATAHLFNDVLPKNQHMKHKRPWRNNYQKKGLVILQKAMFLELCDYRGARHKIDTPWLRLTHFINRSRKNHRW